MAYTLVPTELIVDGAITSAKLDTNIAISGTLGVTGEVTLATHLIMGDNDKIKIGTGGDLEIYHDGSNSYISNSTGNLYLGDTNGSVHIQAKLNEESIICAADGAVTLYYDNSSKLATTSTGIDVTGTATMDGLTVDGNAVVRSGNTLTLNRTDNAIGGAMSYVAGTGFIFNDANGDGTSFNVGVANRMRIDTSGNVGIGVTSPSSFNAAGTGIATVSGTGTGASTLALYSGTTSSGFLYFSDGTTGADRYQGYVEYSHSGNNMRIGTAGSERMRIDSSGNVGIGATSANSSRLRLDNGGTSGAPQLMLTATGASTQTEIRHDTSNNLIFENWNSGRTERMRIDSSGNVGIGTTADIATSSSSSSTGFWLSSSDYLAVARNQQRAAIFNRIGNDGEIVAFRKDGSTVGSIGVDFSTEFYMGGGGGGFYINSASIRPTTGGDAGTLSDNSHDLGSAAHRFKDLYLSGAITAGAANSTPVVLTLATANSNCDITMNSANTSSVTRLRNGTNDFQIHTNGTERMRIDSSGRLLLGTTSQIIGTHNHKLGVVAAGVETPISTDVNQTVDRYAIDFHNPNGRVGNVLTNGTSTSFNTSSDARLKEVTGKARGLEVINELNPVSYNWKSDGKADEGLIAQEVIDIVPNAVTGSEEEQYYMDYSKLVVHLVAGIKEQQTIIDDLKTRIETLEG